MIPAQMIGVKNAAALPVNDVQPFAALSFQVARFCRRLSFLLFSARMFTFFLICIVYTFSLDAAFFILSYGNSEH
jgi:hypothetical protein